MTRSPLGLRLDGRPGTDLKDWLRLAAGLGAQGLVLDASGELSPDRLGETGRRDLRQTLRTMELSLVALNLPTRRAFDTDTDLDDRLARAERAFSLAFDLGTRLVLARVGLVPEESEPARRETFAHALRELGRRADRRGVRLAIEVGEQPGAVTAGWLDALEVPVLAASLDPATALRAGHDPAASAVALGPHLAHSYAGQDSGSGSTAHPRGFGFRSGVLDWESYLGALEEIGYRGFLTVWPEPTGDISTQFRSVADVLRRF